MHKRLGRFDMTAACIGSHIENVHPLLPPIRKSLIIINKRYIYYPFYIAKNEKRIHKWNIFLCNEKNNFDGRMVYGL